MIEQSGRVVARGARSCWVVVERTSTCGACAARDGCGERSWQERLGQRLQQIEVPGQHAVAVGDRVVVGVDERALLRASLLVYGLPLVAMALGAGVGGLLGVGDLGVALSAGVGLLVGLLSVKTLSRRLSCNPRYHPQLLRRS